MSETSEIHFVECICCECGIRWRVPRDLYDGYNRRGAAFYCPNGHMYGWTTSQAEREVARLRGSVDWYKDLLAGRDRTIASLRGQVTRLKNERAALDALESPCA